MSRKLPANASVAHAGSGALLSAPAAVRNRDDICDLLNAVAPTSGRALELASGTGQHVIAFAARCSGLIWQPTDIDPDRIASIDAYASRGDATNILRAHHLDACEPGWSADQPPANLIVVINLLHLISLAETETLITQAAKTLTPGGRIVIYGPFMRAGELTSAGDRRFHESLTSQDPQIGYKDDFDIMDLLHDAGLEMVEVVEMPANNLALIAEKPAV